MIRGLLFAVVYGVLAWLAFGLIALLVIPVFSDTPRETGAYVGRLASLFIAAPAGLFGLLCHWKRSKHDGSNPGSEGAMGSQGIDMATPKLNRPAMRTGLWLACAVSLVIAAGLYWGTQRWTARIEEDERLVQPPPPASHTIPPAVLDQLMPEAVRQSEAAAARHQQRVGEGAPLFERQLLDGKTFNLKDQLGQGIIVLRFWSTLSELHTNSLIAQAEMASSYHDRGVEFYGVNFGDTAADIGQFFGSSEPGFPVILDPDLQLDELYDIELMTEAFVIDSDGKIRAVTHGNGERAVDLLRLEIERVLAGQD
jgi:alkyl hydroperoxide reductase subunit AhpC